MKYGSVILRVRNPSDQSQPGRSVASLATGRPRRVQKRDGNGLAMRRHVNEQIVGSKPRNKLISPRCREYDWARRQQRRSSPDGEREQRTWRGLGPRYARRRWPRNLGGPRARWGHRRPKTRETKVWAGMRCGSRRGPIGAMTRGNEVTPDPAEQRGSAPRRIELQEGTMSDATTSKNRSPGLEKVADRAKRHPDQRILALAHLIDEPALERAFRGLRRDAAVGVDGVTVEQYGGQLAANLQSLRVRMKAGQYRHQPIRRVNIPKENGASRPIGISTVEDKIVQGAMRDVLEAIYEQDFLACSYGFRPSRSAHDAIRTLNSVVMRGHANYIVEADIVSFFDNIDRKVLMDAPQPDC
jgi:hypothetical protein